MATYIVRKASLPHVPVDDDYAYTMRVDVPIGEAYAAAGRLPQQSSGWSRVGASNKNSNINRELPVRWGRTPRKPYGIE